MLNIIDKNLIDGCAFYRCVRRGGKSDEKETGILYWDNALQSVWAVGFWAAGRRRNERSELWIKVSEWPEQLYEQVCIRAETLGYSLENPVTEGIEKALFATGKGWWNLPCSRGLHGQIKDKGCTLSSNSKQHSSSTYARKEQKGAVTIRRAEPYYTGSMERTNGKERSGIVFYDNWGRSRPCNVALVRSNDRL